MLFRILGPFEVTDDQGHLVAIGGPKQRAALAILLLHAGEVVSTERIIDELWGDRAPVRAAKGVQMLVSQLRKAVGDGLVVTRPPGYVLSLDPDQLDSHRFERTVREVETAEPAVAAPALRGALALWRGPALADLAYESFAQPAIRRLEELRLVVVERAIEAELSLGREAELIAELETLVAEHPLRERLSAQLMRALYRAGRQADALARYRRTRELLVDELGLEPGRELVELERLILAQDPVLDPPRPEAAAKVPAPAAVHGAPLPTRLAPYGPTVFADRRAERAALAAAIADGATSERRAAFVTGEAGIGKTRLVSEVAREAHAAGALVLAGRCDNGLDLPYQPFVEALEDLVEYASAELLRAHVTDFGESVTRLVPALAAYSSPRPATPHESSESERYVLFRAIEGLLAAAGAGRSLLLVLEDLHWADLPTLKLLRRLLTSPRATPVTLLSTCRVTELAADHPLRELLSDLHREPHVLRLELGGLEGDDVIDLLRGLADGRPRIAEQELARALEAQTGGNPFFITELVKSLTESDELSADTDHPGPGGVPTLGDLPQSVNETVLRRIDHLGAGPARCLATAAVIGDEFDLDLVDAVTTTEDVADGLDRSVRAGLLIEVSGGRPRLRFTHALVRRCLYAELGMGRRAELHRRVAVALEPRCAGGHISAAELAGHWLAAAGTGPDETDRALHYAALAGDEALAQLAPDEARRWYEIALEQLPLSPGAADSDRCHLLIRRGESERQAGDPRFRETLLEAAALAGATGDKDALVRAALANTRGLQSATGVVDGERVATVTAALAAVGDADSAARARLLALQAAELTFDDRRRCVELSDESVAVARRIGDPATLSFVLALRFVAIWSPEMHAERDANTIEALAACDRLDDPLATFHACHWRGIVCIEGGDVAQARRWITRERELADRMRQPTSLWLATGDEANLAIIEGRLTDAERLATEAFAVGEPSEPDALACFAAQLTVVRFHQGELGTLVAMIEQVVDANPGIPGFRSTLALALCEAGRLPDAHRMLRAEAETGFAGIVNDATWLAVVCIFAEVASRVGDADAASALRALLEPWSGMIAFPGWGPWGPVDHHLGHLALTLGDLDRAERWLGLAAEREIEIGAPIWTAATRLQLARVMRRRGADDGAGGLLGTVIEVAERCGAHGLAREARSEPTSLVPDAS